MPMQISYPGVYVEELPSGNHTILGVPTATTAFIGRALRGPVDEPIAVYSVSDFEQMFGEVAADYSMASAVSHFFLNGGSEAIIIRRFVVPQLETVSVTDTDSSAVAQISVGDLHFQAANPGCWGNGISVEIDKTGITEQVAAAYQNITIFQGVKSSTQRAIKDDLFNLTVLYQGKPVERFPCLTLVGDERNLTRLDSVLQHQSNYLRVVSDMPDDAPATLVSCLLSGGVDSALLSSGEDYLGSKTVQTGIYALDNTDIFNLLCIPADRDTNDESLVAINAEAAAFCEHNRAIFIAEPLNAWTQKANEGQWFEIKATDLGINDNSARFACAYFPKVKMQQIDAKSNAQGNQAVFSSSGVIAGVMANNDANRGVWAAAAGRHATMVGVTGLAVDMNDTQNAMLNESGINGLRDFPVIGPVVWGDRTLRGADLLGDDYKYLSVRRLTNYIETSLQRSIGWAVFEQNDEMLWSQLRLSINDFMQALAQQGAFYNYNVRCDASTTTPQDVAQRIVNIEISFAPVKPNEFITFELQQATS